MMRAMSAVHIGEAAEIMFASAGEERWHTSITKIFILETKQTTVNWMVLKRCYHRWACASSHSTVQQWRDPQPSHESVRLPSCLVEGESDVDMYHCDTEDSC